VTSDLGRHLATWEARAALADARADAEARRAQRAEAIVANGPLSLRELHAELVVLHRRNEERHRSTARLHRSLVDQLQLWHGRVSVALLLAHAVADASRCPSSAIVLLDGHGSTADFVATNGVAEVAQDLEFVHDEGPLHAACAAAETRTSTMGEIEQEWPSYGRELAALGIQIVVAAPLRAGSAVIGAVGLFDPPSTALGDAALDGLASGVTPVLLEHGADDLPTGPPALDGMQQIHRAAGVVAAEAGCDVHSALALLRARAFVCGEPAGTIARRILDGELHLSL
jgi:hypothetical protein